MIYEVKSPILGLEQIAQIKLEELDERFVLIKGLKSDGVENGIELRLVNPYALKQNYSLTVPVAIQTLIDMHSNSKVKIYCTILFQEPIENSRVNFLAPLIFNEDNQTVAQIILNQQEYPDFNVADPISNYLHIYDLKSPILGLEQVARIEFNEVDERFVRIKGLRDDNSDSGIALTLVNPYKLKKDYMVAIPDSIQTAMDIQREDSVLLYCPVVIQSPIENSLVNFRAPIVFNTQNKTAAQISIPPNEYPEHGFSEPIKQFIALDNL